MSDSRASALVAGILGGSGSHVVQIIIGVVVVVALIGYFVVRLGDRGGGDVRAVAASVSEHDRGTDRGGEQATSEATVRLMRMWSGIGIGAQSSSGTSRSTGSWWDRLPTGRPSR